MAPWRPSDGPLEDEKDYAATECQEDHPVRLPRHPEQPKWNDYSERARAIRAGKAGYMCLGGAEHWYPLWSVVDTASPDYYARSDTFTTYRHAVEHRDELNAKEAK